MPSTKRNESGSISGVAMVFGLRRQSVAPTPFSSKSKKPDLGRVLDLFPILKDMLHRKGGVLSGGQQQQLAIGRALLTNPNVLLLDEPTEGIQPNIIDQIAETIIRIRSQGLDSGKPAGASDPLMNDRSDGKIGILLVEQYLDFCLDVADRFYIMDRGSIVAEGPMSHMNDDIVKQHLTV